MIKKLFFSIVAIIFCGQLRAQYYPVFSKTLKNGLKVIVCEKPGNDFVETEVWYRVGSKDESPGIRGMAHLFEHMMFRGTKKFPNDSFDKQLDEVGGSNNAYTSFDRTVYHQSTPASALETILDLESDRMVNLVVTQDILNTEREVVGEELRIGTNNWYRKLLADRYPLLYPEGHPYEVDVIGFLPEITSFTAEQCMKFYNNYYSPNNAYLIVVGNVKSENVFALAEKYFGPITKQLNLKPKENLPDLFTAKVKQTEMALNFPVQIYSYIFPKPPVNHKDFFAINMLTQLLFTADNSILNNRLVKKDHLAFGLISTSDDWSLYPNYNVIDVIMSAAPGNIKVKKAIREEINNLIENGIDQEDIDSYVKSEEASSLMENYTASDIASQMGIAEYYFNDYKRAFSLTEEYKKVTPEDIKRVAATYFSEEKIQVINIKPE